MLAHRQEAYMHQWHDHRTANEAWTIARDPGAHWYGAGADFALHHLGDSRGACLVIGSPLHEARELAEAGWDVTYLDVRKPPMEVRFVEADATDMPLSDAIFDAVSSTCVLCHAGMGRYGDPLVENGDEKMLAEIHRVLKPGAKAAIMFGPVMNTAIALRIGSLQRVYTVGEIARLAAKTGFEILEIGIWAHDETGWRSGNPENPIRDGVLYIDKLDYASALLRKKP